MTRSMVGQPSASALSVAAFNSTMLPPRWPPSAVMTTLAPASSMRSLSDSAENPPNTTEWIAPMRAHACIAITASRNERHVDDDAIAALHALRLERVGKRAHLSVQLAIAQAPRVSRLAFEDDRRLVATIIEMHVETIERDVELPIGEPAIVGGAGLIQSHRERLVPRQFLSRQIRPESGMIRRGPAIQVLAIGGLDASFGGESRRRWKAALFKEHRLDVLAGHQVSQRWMRACSGLERGKCASRYSIWSASTRRPLRKMYSA